MNFKKGLLAATLLGGLLAPALAAPAAAMVSQISVSGSHFRAPRPIRIVTPVDIPCRYQNEIVRLSLTVDEDGRASNVQLLTGRDPGLVKRLESAIGQWEFEPATRNGQPVTVNVVLPLQLVDAPVS